MFRALIRFVIVIVEKVISEFALVAAFVSMAQTGRPSQRIVGGLESLYDTFYGFGAAYVANEQFRDVWGRFVKAFTDGLEAAAKNIETDPNLVLFAFIATMVSFKLTAWLLRLVRKNLLKKHAHSMKPPKRGGAARAASPTYSSLYEPPPLSPSTSAQLDQPKGRSDRAPD